MSEEDSDATVCEGISAEDEEQDNSPSLLPNNSQPSDLQKLAPLTQSEKPFCEDREVCEGTQEANHRDQQQDDPRQAHQLTDAPQDLLQRNQDQQVPPSNDQLPCEDQPSSSSERQPSNHIQPASTREQSPCSPVKLQNSSRQSQRPTVFEDGSQDKIALVRKLVQVTSDSMTSLKDALAASETQSDSHKRDLVERMKVIGQQLKRLQEVSVDYNKSARASRQKSVNILWTKSKLAASMKLFSKLAATVKEKCSPQQPFEPTEPASKRAHCDTSTSHFSNSSDSPKVFNLLPPPRNPLSRLQNTLQLQPFSQTSQPPSQTTLTCSQATSQVVSSIDEAPPSGPLIDHGYFSSFQSTHVPTTASAHNSTRGGTIPSVQLTTARSGQASLVQPQSNTSNTATVPTQPTTTLTICNQGSLIVTNEHLKQLALNKRGGTSNLLSVQGQVCSNLNQSVQLQPIQAAGPPTNSEASAGAEKMSGLSELVSLDVMLQEGCLTPGEDCLSLTLMGVTFTAGLLRNGSLSTPSGEVYKVLLQWANACWEKLGHKGKKMKRQQAYKNIYYDKEPLLHYCQRYNKKRVKSYLDQVQTSSSSAFQPQQQPQEHNQGSLPQLNSLCASHLPSSSSSTAVPKRHKDHSCDPLKTKTTSTPQSVAQILSSCKVFSVSERELCGEECLPEGFWISDGGIKHWPADLLAALEWD